MPPSTYVMVLAMWGREKASMLHSIVSTEHILIGAAGELAHVLFVHRRELLQSAIVLGVSLLLWLLLWLCLETVRRFAERRELERRSAGSIVRFVGAIIARRKRRRQHEENLRLEEAAAKAEAERLTREKEEVEWRKMLQRREEERQKKLNGPFSHAYDPTSLPSVRSQQVALGTLPAIRKQYERLTPYGYQDGYRRLQET